MSLRKWVLALLGLRRYAPAPWERPPGEYDGTEDGQGDTGGGGWYRPAHRRQDPSVDPAEPGGGESSGAGNDHGWSNCTMAAGAMALDFHTLGRLAKWGGHLRHHQGDQSGGTDLYDLQEAWDAYGEDLVIRSGAGWGGLQSDRDAGRYLVVQGTGNVPGSATFDGGHACVLGPEHNQDGQWLWGDPLAGGWQWVDASAVRKWMEAWSAGLAYARTAAHAPATPPPDPVPVPPTPVPPTPPPFDPAPGLDHARAMGQAEALDAVYRSWSPGRPRTPLVTFDYLTWDQGAWCLVPFPLVGLVGALTPAAWDAESSTWTGALWRAPDPPPLPPGAAWDLDPWSAAWAR